jgi:hypothetical protein
MARRAARSKFDGFNGTAKPRSLMLRYATLSAARGVA